MLRGVPRGGGLGSAEDIENEATEERDGSTKKRAKREKQKRLKHQNALNLSRRTWEPIMFWNELVLNISILTNTHYIYIYIWPPPILWSIFLPQIAFFPQFYSKNWPKKGGVNLLSLFWGHVFGCPKHGGETVMGQESLTKQGISVIFGIWFPCRQDLYFQQQKWHFPPF